MDSTVTDPQDPPDWRSIASALAWSMTGEKRTPMQQDALDLFDAAAKVDAANFAIARARRDGSEDAS
jgi:hypothetical protein